MGTLTTFDLIIFFGSLLAIMGVGLWAGRKEETSEDFYLAGKQTRWWGVAGSIFGSNVSANHLVGMMGVGFMFGFAQSHFEITAIAGLLMLCYAFLPMYRKLNVFTLSEYLARRFNEPSRLAYALIMVVIMVVIQMVPGFYIGSRSVNILLQGGEQAIAKPVVEDGKITQIIIRNPGKGYASPPTVRIAAPENGRAAQATAELTEDGVSRIALDDPGAGYSTENPPVVLLDGGASFDPMLKPTDVDPKWYIIGILLMAVITGTYVIFGGLKAVIITDVIQSVLLLGAGLLVAYVVFSHPDVGGWANMVAMDADRGAERKLTLYNPSDHPGLPWTGVLSGLMVLHFYYWGTNQFIVQRALAARSDSEAKLGIISAGFFKLLIPFFSIGTGIAAWYFYQAKGVAVAQDAVFMRLLTDLVAPIGFGLVGLVAAGVIGAILSSLDSMMNSAATIFTFDIYRRFIDPEATEQKLILVGRICIVVFICFAAVFTIFTMDPNSKDSFFLHVANHQGKLVAGVVVAFFLGMVWKRASAAGAVVAIVAGVALSYSIEPAYDAMLGTRDVASVTKTTLGFADAHGYEDGDSVVFHTHAPHLPPSADLQKNGVYTVQTVDEKTIRLLDGESGTAASLPAGFNKPAALYDDGWQGWAGRFGPHLNFFHAVFLAAMISAMLHITISLAIKPDEEKGQLTWVGLGVHHASTLKKFAGLFVVSMAIYALLGFWMVYGSLVPTVAAWVAALWTLGVIGIPAVLTKTTTEADQPQPPLWKNDRAWAALLAACAVFMMYYFK
ncbi:MAG: hypothetical protein R3236_01075 [Phycisphaeraceae bacterium]|nr:hypothetical protein [Phycisphaeraceae bacterium]